MVEKHAGYEKKAKKLSERRKKILYLREALPGSGNRVDHRRSMRKNMEISESTALYVILFLQERNEKTVALHTGKA